jgi:hypothetical protein
MLILVVILLVLILLVMLAGPEDAVLIVFSLAKWTVKATAVVVSLVVVLVALFH